MKIIDRIKKHIASYGRKYNWANMGSGIPFFEKMRCLECHFIHGVNTEHYVAMELYKKRHAEIRKYMNYRQNLKINRKMVQTAELNERRSIGNKLRFDEVYSKAGFVKRAFLGTENASIEEIAAFIQKHGEVFKKPIYLSGGTGIELLRWDEMNDERLAELKKENYVLEERIVQHHALSAVNASSVNSVRIVTILDRNHTTQIVGAVLRCGGNGSIADNLHSGGVAYPIDLKTGRIMCLGRDNETEKSYDTHPSSGALMMGMQVPNWDILLQEVRAAAQLSQKLIYLGWDIAVTEEGVDFIEANFGHGVDAIQYDNVGKKELIRKMLEGTPCAF